ncbi:unnamed protein product [Toxocara canis]|uniref:SDE2/SF3A3 SAP domain-containing protein n=1 Tax=Toxocara canis TaxID=6265 RepID=A0A3P7FFP2_TOXCA|nr:unnamed protein product [Toxocara canis]
MLSLHPGKRVMVCLHYILFQYCDLPRSFCGELPQGDMCSYGRVMVLFFQDYGSCCFSQEKYEKLKAGPPKHDFNDSKYIETREKLLDQTDDAFEAESGGEKNSNTSASNGSVRSTCEKEAIEYTSVNLDEYDSADALCSLGLNHLKHALEVRGLKCGGSLAERAARLFSVRGLAPDQYPKSARASSLKKAT